MTQEQIIQERANALGVVPPPWNSHNFDWEPVEFKRLTHDIFHTDKYI